MATTPTEKAAASTGIGTALGAGIGTLIAPGVGTALGAGIGGQLGAALGNWMISDDANTASQAERDKIQALIDNLKTPGFDVSKITPQDYKVVGKFVPEVIPMIEEANPKIVEKTKDMQEGRSAQMDAIRYMRGIAASGKDPIAEMDRLKGARQAAMEANTQNQNIASDMQRRGIGDSAMQMGLQGQQAGAAGYNTAMAGEQAARDALSRRMGASQEAAGIGGQVFASEQGLEAQNANIINDFNQRMSARRQQLADLNVGNRNQANANDLANQQAIANTNTQQTNQAAIQQQAKENAAKQTAYQDELNKIGLQSGQGQGNIRGIQDAAAGNQALITGVGQAINTLGTTVGDYNQPPKKTQKQLDEEYPEYPTV